jgi:hypothetical protein
VHDDVWLGARTSAHVAPATVTECCFVSVFVQSTESPAWIDVACGLNPVLVILTPDEPARAVDPIASTPIATAASIHFRT